MSSKTIFISHQFQYYTDLELLKVKLDESGWNCTVYSIPEHDAFDFNRKKDIEVELKNQIEEAFVILILARTTLGNSFWVINELKYAKNSNKITIGIIPNEYNRPIPLFILKACDDFTSFEIEKILQLIEKKSKSI